MQKNIDVSLAILRDFDDVAKFFSMKSKHLAYILYSGKDNREGFYNEFNIPKRSGGTRTIAAPKEQLSTLQSKLSDIFEEYYIPRPSAHAYLLGRSIKTNALAHVRKKFILNIDLKDFFGFINFGRVRGMLMANPYNMTASAATVFAQILCYKGSLPQGAPSSPIVSNMICSRLDGQMQRFAKQERCTYTRYADDITFSTNLSKLPDSLGVFDGEKFHVGASIQDIVKSNGFEINTNKVYLQTRMLRQVVTGLVVNEFVNVTRSYVRNLRAVLYNWEKFGIDQVTKEYFEKYQPQSKNKSTKSFKKIIRGQIEYVRMIRSPVVESKQEKLKLNMFYKFLDRFNENCIRDCQKTVVRTEGKTDWMHFESAYLKLRQDGKYKDLDIDFHKTKDRLLYGDSKLISFCERAKDKTAYKEKVICIFDRDVKKTVDLHSEKDGIFIREWGANVFSLLIPSLDKNSNSELCIEMLYKPELIKGLYYKDARLFLKTEFEKDGTHKELKDLKFVGPKNRLNGIGVIDSDVINISNGKKVALSKYRFAKTVAKNKESIDFSLFEALFEAIIKVQSLK